MSGSGLVRGGLIAIVVVFLTASLAPAAQAAPQLGVSLDAQPPKMIPGDLARFEIPVTNTGDEPTSGPITLDVTLPAGFEITATTDRLAGFIGEPIWDCSFAANTASCEGPSQTAVFGLLASIGPGEAACGMFEGCPLLVKATAGDPAPGAEAAVEACGGTAASCASTAVPLEFGEAGFRIDEWDGDWTVDEKGDPFTQAGGHPYSASSFLEIGTHFYLGTEFLTPVAAIRNAVGEFPPGIVGAPDAIPTCDGMKELFDPERNSNGGNLNVCPTSSIVGTAEVTVTRSGVTPDTFHSPIFNMKPSTNVPAQFGFLTSSFPVLLDVFLRSDGDYGVNINSRNISQGLSVSGFKATFWGVPGDSSHDYQRCIKYSLFGGLGEPECTGPSDDPQTGPNPYPGEPKAFLTNPTSCTAPAEGREVRLQLESWEKPPSTDDASFITHVPGDRSAHVGNDGCDVVPFTPDITIQPGTKEADQPTGLQVKLKIPTDGIENPTGIAQSAVKKTVVTLPEGMSVNPSYADGVDVCTPEQIGMFSVDPPRFDKAPVGCSDASKIGDVEVETPLIDTILKGGLYAAQSNDEERAGPENPFDAMVVIYVVLEGAGIRVKLPGEVVLNERTGQLVAIVDNAPQVPFSEFTLNFKGGPRAPLVTPSTCGTFTSAAKFSPWARPDEEVTDTDPFTITSGPGGGPCVNDSAKRPFRPLFKAGSLNNNAGSYSPFVMRVTRNDGEQELTSFAADLPPGLIGRIAGMEKCSDAAIEAAKTKSGKAEKRSPSCPASSKIGEALTGSGSGQILTYVPGNLYLAGPYDGAPLSVVVIVPADVGPVDVGTVVIRVGLRLDPDDAQVHVDPVPIPYIKAGVPLHVKDIRVNLDREKFTLNPTNCDPSAVEAKFGGTGGNFATPFDDLLARLTDPFQVANCAALGFKPKLDLKLNGGTKRGGHPGLTATYKPREGDANVKGLVVRLPRSAFLDQAHIRTICTRVQFAADSCPKGAQYGYIKAWTPLIDEPLEGPVWLRSSNHKLPDLVFDLRGIVDVEVATRIDSARGGIRATVQSAPDAPLTKVLLRMQGGKKGLIVNSKNLCAVKSRANAEFSGHNGKRFTANPVMRADCGGKKRGGKRAQR